MKEGKELNKEGYHLKEEDIIKERMYRLGYEDARKNRKYGSSVNNTDYEDYLKSLGMEQVTLF